ncbi:hypothetical protein F4776DRAFT_664119 [Hypoxylon sp. NC0597]|nr:hypothetical protein F4776DRAFT_664119 [Hypoxylon sp. NC0597]
MDVAQEIQALRDQYQEGRLRLQWPSRGWIIGFIVMLACLFLHNPKEWELPDGGEIPPEPTIIPIVVEPQYNVVDLTNAMEPLWKGYQSLLFHNASGSWFNEAEANNKLISDMFNAVPSWDENGTENAKRPQIRAMMERRAKYLAGGNAAFKQFLDVRQQIIRDLISNHYMWRQYAGRNEVTECLLQIAEGKNPLETKDSEMKDYPAETVVYAHHLAYNMSRLFKDTWIPAIDSMVNRIEDVRHYTASALLMETPLIEHLQAESTNAHLWNSSRHDGVTHELLSKVVGLREVSKDVLELLKLIKAGWPRANTVAKTSQETFLFRARVARDLMQHWAMVVMYSEEGVLFGSRRNQYTKAGRGPESEYDASWKEWKKRNCGGTSCLGVENTIDMLKIIWGFDTLPGCAQDEAEWKATPNVPKDLPGVLPGTYEEACCVDGKLAHFLKYVPPVILDTIREIQGGH